MHLPAYIFARNRKVLVASVLPSIGNDDLDDGEKVSDSILPHRCLMALLGINLYQSINQSIE